MATSIVVLIDIEAKSVQLFGEYNRVIPFEDLYLLPIFLDGKEVLYVTQGEVVFGNEAIDTITQIAEQCELSSEPRYFHTTQEGYLKVVDIKLTLAGRRDSKPISQFGLDVFRKSAALRKHITDGTIEIITESRAKNLKKSPPSAVNKDKALDDMIIKTSVSDALDRDDFDDDDIITSEQGDIETETEQILKKIDHLREKR